MQDRPSSTAELRDFLKTDTVGTMLNEVMAKTMTADRVIQMVLTASTKNPDLFNCTFASIITAARIAAQVGLDCSGVLGRGYLVPFGKEAVFIPGYLGLCDIVRRSGEVIAIRAKVVYKDDHFLHTEGLTPDLQHKPNYEGDRSDDAIVKAYMIAELKQGTPHIEVMTRDEIEKVRAVSKAKNNGPWVTWYPEMCKKTVTRRGTKFLPISLIEQQDIVMAESQEFSFNQQPQQPAIDLKPTEGREKFGTLTPQDATPPPQGGFPEYPEEPHDTGDPPIERTKIKKAIQKMEIDMSSAGLSDTEKETVRRACRDAFERDSRADLTDDHLAAFNGWCKVDMNKLIKQMKGGG